MSERKLVTFREISDIRPIEGADAIEVAVVDGWKVVVKKGEFYVGQKIFYFEIDSMLPLERNYFNFLRDRGIKVKDGKEYHRLKTIKLRGQVSQGLILPHSIFTANWRADWDDKNSFPVSSKDEEGNTIPAYYDPDESLEKEVDIMENLDGDFSDYFGVIKYEPEGFIGSGKASNWPSDIEKTDEERIQNLPGLLDTINIQDWYATEKIDGTSITMFMRSDGSYGVCSRNYELEEVEGDKYWENAKKAHFFEIMRSFLDNYPETSMIVFQGELFGPGIQGNPLQVKEQQILLYNVCVDGERLTLGQVHDNLVLSTLYFNNWVPIHNNKKLSRNLDTVIEQPDGVKTLVKGANKDAQIEGFVWRRFSSTKVEYAGKIKTASFKSISAKYLLKHDG